MNLVNGMDTLRNRLSYSHGRGGKLVKSSPRHGVLKLGSFKAVFSASQIKCFPTAFHD